MNNNTISIIIFDSFNINEKKLRFKFLLRQERNTENFDKLTQEGKE